MEVADGKIANKAFGETSVAKVSSLPKLLFPPSSLSFALLACNEN